MKNDLVKRLDVQKMLRDLDGWDALEEFFKGWDKAIHVAEMKLESLPSKGSDLIRRSDVMEALANVFEEYNYSFEPNSQSRGFAGAVPAAIYKIPSVLEPLCENVSKGGRA